MCEKKTSRLVKNFHSRPYAHITGWGMCIPSAVLTNHALGAFLDIDDGWIRERTGIRERHVVGEAETTAELSR